MSVAVVATAHGAKAEYVEPSVALSRASKSNKRLRVFNVQVGVGRTLLSSSQRALAHNVSAGLSEEEKTANQKSQHLLWAAETSFSMHNPNGSAAYLLGLAEDAKHKYRHEHDLDLYPYSLWLEDSARARERYFVANLHKLPTDTAVTILQDIQNAYIELSHIAVEDPLRRRNGYYQPKIHICEDAWRAITRDNNPTTRLKKAQDDLREIHELEDADRYQRFGRDEEKRDGKTAAFYYAIAGEQFLFQNKDEEAKILFFRGAVLAEQARHFGLAARCYLQLTEIARRTSNSEIARGTSDSEEAFHAYTRMLDVQLIHEGHGLVRAELIKLLSRLWKAHKRVAKALSNNPEERDEVVKHYSKAGYFQGLQKKEEYKDAMRAWETDEERAETLAAVEREMKRIDQQAMEDRK